MQLGIVNGNDIFQVFSIIRTYIIIWNQYNSSKKQKETKNTDALPVDKKAYSQHTIISSCCTEQNNQKVHFLKQSCPIKTYVQFVFFKSIILNFAEEDKQGLTKWIRHIRFFEDTLVFEKLNLWILNIHYTFSFVKKVRHFSNPK